MRILVADDSNVIRQIVRGSAKVLGHETLEAATGQEAVRLLRAHHTSIVLAVLDSKMPRGGGLEILREMRSDERLSKIPVLMLVTRGDSEEVAKAMAEGATDCLAKPFSQQDLATRMHECLLDAA